MESQKTEHLNNPIQSQPIESLNNSESSALLVEHDLSDLNSLETDNTITQSTNELNGQEAIQNIKDQILSNNIELESCAWINGKLVCDSNC